MSTELRAQRRQHETGADSGRRRLPQSPELGRIRDDVDLGDAAAADEEADDGDRLLVRYDDHAGAPVHDRGTRVRGKGGTAIEDLSSDRLGSFHRWAGA